MVTKEIAIITLVTLVTMVTGEKQCSEFYYDRVPDHKLTCGIFKTTAANLIDCNKLCVSNIKCFSTNTYAAENGTEMCDLVKGSKKSSAHCFVSQIGSIYNEITSTKNCESQQNCSSNPIRKALADGWYQIGSSAFKNFHDNKTWTEAKETCAANQGTLVRFDSELEKQFVYKINEDSGRPVIDADDAKISGLNPLRFWRLDGTESDITLHGEASYQMDNLIKVLDLPGTTGSYATTPKFDEISRMDFTIAMWVKMPESASLPYSSWASNHVFTFAASHFTARKGSYQADAHFAISPASVSSDPKWLHVAGVWNRQTRTAQLFHDGIFMGSGTSSETDPIRLNFPISPNPVFDIGMKRDPLVYRQGKVRNLIAFTKPFTAEEVKALRDATEIIPPRQAFWIGSPPASSSIPFPSELNTGCVAMATKGVSFDWLKVSCDLRLKFICKKTI